MSTIIKTRLNKQNIKRGIHFLKRNGIRETFFKASERLFRDIYEENYEAWLLSHLPDEAELVRQRSISFRHAYKISILVPTYETDLQFFREMIESVIAQTYTNWELCIADGSSSNSIKNCVMEMVGKYADVLCNCRIKYQKLDKNYGISINSNKALEMATGEYVGLLDHDDLLTPNALFEIVSALQNGIVAGKNVETNHICALYSDEDKIDSSGKRFFDYHNKPSFDLDLLRSNNYICHFFVVKQEIAEKIGGFRTEFNGAQDHDFILRSIENVPSRNIVHISKVLYHWRAHENSTADNPESKLYAYEAGKLAVEAHLERIGVKAEVLYTPQLGFFRVKYVAEDAAVTFMTKDEWDTIELHDLELIPNDYIMILNNNIKPLTRDWQVEMLGHLSRKEVGAVGGKVLDNKNRIESAGYSKNEEGKLVANYRGMSRYYSGYLHRACLQQEVEGLPLDCMMIKKSALVWNLTRPVMSKEFITVFDPYVVFRRR